MRATISLLFATVAIASTGTATAQGLAVAPIDRQITGATQFPFHVPASSAAFNKPFAEGISRVQYVYETSFGGRTLLDLPSGAQITSIGFPADGTMQSFGNSLQLEVLMAHTTKTAANAESTFANNYTSTPQSVFPRQIYRLPDLNNPLAAGGLRQEAEVVFDRPFIFNGTDNLLVEFRVTANSNGNQAFNYRLDSGTDNSLVETIGQGCATSNNTTPTLVSRPTAIGDIWDLRASGAPASSMSSLIIGFNLLPLPADLAVIGAPGCSTYINVAASVPSSTDTVGRGFWNFRVGDDISLWQVDIYSQLISFDLFANNAGLVTSNADRMQIGINPRITVISNRGSATAATGQLRRNWGQVSYFRYS